MEVAGWGLVGKGTPADMRVNIVATAPEATLPMRPLALLCLLAATTHAATRG
jgi:hypothetical protein